MKFKSKNAIFNQLANLFVKKNLAIIKKDKLQKILQFRERTDTKNNICITLRKNVWYKKVYYITCNSYFYKSLFSIKLDCAIHFIPKDNVKVYINQLNKIYFYRKIIPFNIRGIPTYFGVAFSLNKNLENIITTIYLGYLENNVIEEIENDDLLIELAKDFIFNNDLQIIDYIQDKDYKISKLF